MLLYFPPRVSWCTVALFRNRITSLFSLIIWRLHFCRTFSIIVICIQDFWVKKVSYFSNFTCTTILAKAPGLLSCPGYSCFSHFFSDIFKKSYNYPLLWPLSTFSFFLLFGKTFRRQSFKKTSTFIHISYVL